MMSDRRLGEKFRRASHGRRTIVRLVIGLLIFLVVSQSEAADWQVYTSRDGRFTATFPGKVAVKQIDNATFYSASPPNVDADFRIATNDRPYADVNFEESFRELQRIRRSIATTQNVQLEEELDFLFNGMPACRFQYLKKVDNRVTALYETIYVLDGRRFYQLICGYDAKKPLAQDAQTFFNSFQITR